MQTIDYQLDSKVKKLAKLKGVTFNEVCEGVKMTPAGLRGTLEKGSSVKLELLDSLCKYFGVEMEYFLSNSDNENDKKVSSSSLPENKYLMDILNGIEKVNQKLLEQVSEQTKTIQEQSHTINILVQKQLGINFKLVTENRPQTPKLGRLAKIIKFHQIVMNDDGDELKSA